ncbi:MAG: low temperature requirement protein A [Armatimonadetes bacterium]|nr:low temperature requirement protein A [Armatimonadota bacterium]
MRLRKDLVRRAVLRTAPGVFEERHATWLELFYDLAFVAAIGQMSLSLSADFTWNGVSRFMLLFIPLWWAWVGQAYFLSRFDSDDLVHRLFALLQIMIVAVLAVYVPSAFEGHYHGYLLAYVGLRVVLVAQYVLAGIQVKPARLLAATYAGGFALAAGICAASLWVPNEIVPLVWGVGLLIDLATPFVFAEQSLKIPPDYSHIPERLGLFTIIVLGEAILAAVSGMRYEGLGPQAKVIGPLGLGLAFAFWWIYFDGVKGHQVQIPVERRDVKRLMLWLFSHMPLAAGIVLTAVGVKHAMTEHHGAGGSSQSAAILVTGVALTLVPLHMIYFASLNRKLIAIAQKISWPHLATTCMVAPIGAVSSGLDPSWLVTALCTIGLVHVVLTFRDLPELDELLRRVESARHQTASNV